MLADFLHRLPRPGETGGDEGGVSVKTATGATKVIPGKADFGTVSSGGLY